MAVNDRRFELEQDGKSKCRTIKVTKRTELEMKTKLTLFESCLLSRLLLLLLARSL